MSARRCENVRNFAVPFPKNGLSWRNEAGDRQADPGFQELIE